MIAWSPLGMGFLSGKYQSGDPPPAASRLADSDPSMRNWIEKHFNKNGYAILRGVEECAKRLNKTMSQISLAWLLAVPGVTSVIIGVRNMRQSDDNMAAAGWDFPTEEWKQLDSVSALPPEYPQDFQAWVEPVIHGDLSA